VVGHIMVDIFRMHMVMPFTVMVEFQIVKAILMVVQMICMVVDPVHFVQVMMPAIFLQESVQMSFIMMRSVLGLIPLQISMVKLICTDS
jgi:hypothetical protein